MKVKFTSFASLSRVLKKVKSRKIIRVSLSAYMAIAFPQSQIQTARTLKLQDSNESITSSRYSKLIKIVTKSLSRFLTAESVSNARTNLSCSNFLGLFRVLEL